MPSFQDVVAELLQAEEEEDQPQQLRALEAAATECMRDGIRDQDTAEYCGRIVLEALLERIAQRFDGQDESGDDEDELRRRQDLAVGWPSEESVGAEDVVAAAQRGERLMPSNTAEALMEAVIEETLHDAGLGEKALFPIATAMEAGNVAERAASLIAATYLQRLRQPVFKIGQACFVFRFDQEEYFPGHVVEVMEDNKYRVQLEGFHTVEVGIEVMSSTSGVDDDDDDDAGEGACELCMCNSRRLTRHHLIPKLVHTAYRRKGFTRAELARTTAICRSCHNTVHRAEPHAILAASYNTVEKLREHPEIVKWVQFASTQRKNSRWDHAMMVSNTRGAKVKKRLK